MLGSHDNSSIIPVVLSGGSGSRLWPISRSNYPKQFIKLTGQKSLLQETVLRFVGKSNIAKPLFVCNQEHRFMLAEQLQNINVQPERIILEPVSRNTAPAACVASLFLYQKYKDPLVLILPADHLIEDKEAFYRSLNLAVEPASQGQIVLFGVNVRSPETGFGYVKPGSELEAGQLIYKVSGFTEKPDQKKAQEYFESGNYLWNSGIFLLRASTYLQEIERLEPKMLQLAKSSLKNAKEDLDFLRLDQSSFEGLPNLSIDYGILEKTERAVLIKTNMGWSDVGSWQSLLNAQVKDQKGNCTQGDVHLNNVTNSFVVAQSRMVVGLGLNDIVIAETADAVLVSNLQNEANLKSIFANLKAAKRSECDTHRRVYRPWGSYETIDAGERFQVKRIIVKPGASLSLQMHKHRAEHWVVVQGEAEVTLEDAVSILQENQSTYIPLGVKHRLRNPGLEPLHLIEVQSGTYLT
jgi:mannose-1-phosphate guanylyltransferase / mannose-6-phosphate isomerase